MSISSGVIHSVILMLYFLAKDCLGERSAARSIDVRYSNHFGGARRLLIQRNGRNPVDMSSEGGEEPPLVGYSGLPNWCWTLGGCVRLMPVGLGVVLVKHFLRVHTLFSGGVACGLPRRCPITLTVVYQQGRDSGHKNRDGNLTSRPEHVVLGGDGLGTVVTLVCLTTSDNEDCGS
ncbi:hypothetical protein ACJJTC_005601 [Scirpophaga incertulas]